MSVSEYTTGSYEIAKVARDLQTITTLIGQAIASESDDDIEYLMGCRDALIVYMKDLAVAFPNLIRTHPAVLEAVRAEAETLSRAKIRRDDLLRRVELLSN
jgi:hypothetical protein